PWRGSVARRAARRRARGRRRGRSRRSVRLAWQGLRDPLVAVDLRLGIRFHPGVVGLDVFGVEQAGEGVGEVQRAFADRRDVAGHDAERERGRVGEGVDALEAGAVRAGAWLELERGTEVGALGELVVL